MPYWEVGPVRVRAGEDSKSIDVDADIREIATGAGAAIGNQAGKALGSAVGTAVAGHLVE